MKKEILHISHHIGCFRDQQYVLNELGFDVTNHKFYDGVFEITESIANDFWEYHKDQFNDFDYILTSDTAPLSRVFLENQNELNTKVIIWICNRFDYRMENQTKYYNLFSHAEDNPNIKIVPYSYFEKIWCKEKGTDIMGNQVIRPCGINSSNLESEIPQTNYFEKMYGNSEELPNADVLVPIYHNDNNFFEMKNFLESKNITVYNGNFKHIKNLKKYKAFVHLPDAFSKFLCFELIHAKVPAILPSKKLLFKISKQPNYFFNIWGSGGANLLKEEWIDWCEWYDPNLMGCRLYYDSFEDIPEIIQSIDLNKMEDNFEFGSNYLKENSISKWKNFYKNF